MSLLNEVDKPGSDIDSYVLNLDRLLLEKEGKIKEIRQKLYDLYIKLKDEEALSNKFSQINESSKFFDKEIDGLIDFN
jgi:kinesin family protein 2/24